MKPFKPLLLAVLAIACLFNSAHAQSDVATLLKKIADGKKFTFKPQYVNLSAAETSLNGSFVNNTAAAGTSHIAIKGDYTVTVQPDSVASNIPYFDDHQIQDNMAKENPQGNAAGIANPTPVKVAGNDFLNITYYEKASHFVSKTYNYAVKQSKNGNVQITITPKDDKELDKLTFELKTTGDTKLTVEVHESNRTITYNGILL